MTTESNSFESEDTIVLEGEVNLPDYDDAHTAIWQGVGTVVVGVIHDGWKPNSQLDLYEGLSDAKVFLEHGLERPTEDMVKTGMYLLNSIAWWVFFQYNAQHFERCDIKAFSGEPAEVYDINFITGEDEEDINPAMLYNMTSYPLTDRMHDSLAIFIQQLALIAGRDYLDALNRIIIADSVGENDIFYYSGDGWLLFSARLFSAEVLYVVGEEKPNTPEQYFRKIIENMYVGEPYEGMGTDIVKYDTFTKQCPRPVWVCYSTSPDSDETTG